MGAWGLEFDENDDAGDWLGEFGDAPEWSSVSEALRATVGVDYLEAPESSVAVAAAEVVAAAGGRASSKLPPELSSWAIENADGARLLWLDAISAVTRVRDNSELAELWDEGDEAADWRATLDDLLIRLNS